MRFDLRIFCWRYTCIACIWVWRNSRWIPLHIIGLVFFFGLEITSFKKCALSHDFLLRKVRSNIKIREKVFFSFKTFSISMFFTKQILFNDIQGFFSGIQGFVETLVWASVISNNVVHGRFFKQRHTSKKSL